MFRQKTLAKTTKEKYNKIVSRNTVNKNAWRIETIQKFQTKAPWNLIRGAFLLIDLLAISMKEDL